MKGFSALVRKNDVNEDIEFGPFPDNVNKMTSPQISFHSRGSTIDISPGPNARVIVSDDRSILLIIVGEVYVTSGQEMADGFQEQGRSFAAGLDGSFALIVADRPRGDVFLVTDRTNSKKVFWAKTEHGIWMSSDPDDFPMTKFKVDAIGLASFLANGVVYNNRTLVEGVRSMPRACIHEIDVHGISHRPYWTHDFGQQFHERDLQSLESELRDLLVESVRQRLDAENPCLSLSAGYDSSAILGILHDKINIPSMVCFSYCRNTPVRGTDAYQASEMARICGYPHQVVRAYDGDFVQLVRRCADYGHGLVDVCEEADGTTALKNNQFTSVLVGDACFGEPVRWDPCSSLSADQIANQGFEAIGEEIDSTQDVFDALRIRGLDRLVGRDLFPHDFLVWLEGLWKDERDAIYERVPGGLCLRDVLDYLYLQQRLGQLHMPWREYHAGLIGKVRNPFLSNALIDFMSKVPSSYRRGKLLYRETVQRMLPHIFEVPRATRTGCEIEWRHELATQVDSMHDLVTAGYSPLDAIFPTTISSALCDRITASNPNYGETAPLPGYGAFSGLGSPNDRPWLNIDDGLLIARIAVARLYLQQMYNIRREGIP